MTNSTSPHILSTSTNLLGFCLVVITTYHLTDKADTTLIDDFTGVLGFTLIFSSFFSFLSMRSKIKKTELKHEKIADYIFMLCSMRPVTIPKTILR